MVEPDDDAFSTMSFCDIVATTKRFPARVTACIGRIDLTMLSTNIVDESSKEFMDCVDGKNTRQYAATRKACSISGRDSGYGSVNSSHHNIQVAFEISRQLATYQTQDPNLLSDVEKIFTPDGFFAMSKLQQLFKTGHQMIEESAVSASSNDSCDETWVCPSAALAKPQQPKSAFYFGKLKCDCAPGDFIGMGTQFDKSKCAYADKQLEYAGRINTISSLELSFRKPPSMNTTREVSYGISKLNVREDSVKRETHGSITQMPPLLAVPLPGRHGGPHTPSSGTFEGSTTGKGFPSTNTSSSAFSYNSRTRSLQNRKLGGKEDDEDGDGNDPTRQGPLEGCEQRTHQGNCLACPFHKRSQIFRGEPRTISHSPKCSRPFVDIADVVQHLKEVHFLGNIYCRRCFKKFKTEERLTMHQRLPISCDIVEDRLAEMSLPGREQRIGFEGYTKKPRGVDCKKHWVYIWTILFPLFPAPSPYWDAGSYEKDQDGDNDHVEDDSNVAGREVYETSQLHNADGLFGSSGAYVFADMSNYHRSEVSAQLNSQFEHSNGFESSPILAAVREGSGVNIPRVFVSSARPESGGNTNVSLHFRDDGAEPEALEVFDQVDHQREQTYGGPQQQLRPGQGPNILSAEVAMQPWPQSLFPSGLMGDLAHSISTDQSFDLGSRMGATGNSTPGPRALKRQSNLPHGRSRPHFQSSNNPYLKDKRRLTGNHAMANANDIQLNANGATLLDNNNQALANRAQAHMNLNDWPTSSDWTDPTQNWQFWSMGNPTAIASGQLASGDQQYNICPAPSGFPYVNAPTNRVQGPLTAAPFADDSSYGHTPSTNPNSLDDSTGAP